MADDVTQRRIDNQARNRDVNREQGKLFDTDPAPWELDDAAESAVASVVFPEGAAGAFDYSVPEALRATMQPGMRVRVPLGAGNRLAVGYCVGISSRPATTRRLKEIRELLDSAPLVSAAMLSLTEWMASYYLCPWGRVLEGVVPSGVRTQAGTRQQLVLSLTRAAFDPGSRPKLSPQQTRVVEILAQASQPLTVEQLMQLAECKESPIQSLRKKGLIEGTYRRSDTIRPPAHRSTPEPTVTLSDAQTIAVQRIVDTLHRGVHQTFVLLGVTGSGKTEVYIRAIEEVIRFGRQAIVLVPEISLTPQTRRRFESRFGSVAVLHSHLSDSERHAFWQQIAAGQTQVVVGARSAVFAPVPQLGLIVLDEEHDSSFKQDMIPRYHARDVAHERAAREHVPLVLGSATPSLESWQQALSGHYQLLRMPERAMARPLPTVDTIDLRLESRQHFYRGGISRQLELAMREALQDRGQVILLLNRRGYSTHIQCPACGEAVRCQHCDVALTHHRDDSLAVCHYCDYRIPAPNRCPKCGFEGIRYGGLGTQRLEAEVRARFGDYAIARMDSDTMQKAGSHELTLSQFRQGEIRILLGTQMIAKGLDFPNVTLVGVINADTALHLPDFRAAERTFQLVTQVAGRTGRGVRGGRVLVQTLNPEHPAIRFATEHDFEGFATWELPHREALGYPPFGSVIRLILRSEVEREVLAAAEELGERLRNAPTPTVAPGSHAPSPADAGDVRVLGPAPAPVARLRNQYRFHLLLLGPDGLALRQTVRAATEHWKTHESVQWVVDCDPHDML